MDYKTVLISIIGFLVDFEVVHKGSLIAQEECFPHKKRGNDNSYLTSSRTTIKKKKRKKKTVLISFLKTIYNVYRKKRSQAIFVKREKYVFFCVYSIIFKNKKNIMGGRGQLQHQEGRGIDYVFFFFFF